MCVRLILAVLILALPAASFPVADTCCFEWYGPDWVGEVCDRPFDLPDAWQFLRCFDGPDSYTIWCDTVYHLFDYDCDYDVDLHDFAWYQNAYGQGDPAT